MSQPDQSRSIHTSDHTSVHRPDAYATSGTSPGTTPVVLKFGSSVLTDAAAVTVAVDEIYRERRAGHPVVAVVSALAGRTDALLANDPGGDPHGIAATVARGEHESARLLEAALDRAGIPSRRTDAGSIGLVSEGPTLDGTPRAVDTAALEALLDDTGVAVVPGFEARDASGRPTLLGRGGSDLTAIFLAAELGARVRLIKDVDGVFDRDPRDAGESARPFARVSWDQAARVAGELVQPRALAVAAERRLPVEVAAPLSLGGTVIGDFPAPRFVRHRRPRPLRVALAGRGSVGAAVYARLLDDRLRFELVGVLVRDADRHARAGVPRPLLVDDVDELLDRSPDVLVELIGGRGVAVDLTRGALQRGIDVVSGNKHALAVDGPDLVAAARVGHARLHYSAAAGGAAPVLETALRAEAVHTVEGVLNGTASAVLADLSKGLDLAAAVASATRAGLAEANPSLDLLGIDAAHKLILIARAAFGIELDVEEIDREAITPATAERARNARERGRSLRQLARVERIGGRLRASVTLAEVDRSSPFANLAATQNLVRFERTDGAALVARGAGAGGVPTAQAVVADLHELWRAPSTQSPAGRREPAAGPC